MCKLIMFMIFIFTILMCQHVESSCFGGVQNCVLSCMARKCLSGYCVGRNPELCVCQQCSM
jgi:hypothetical protein